MTTEQYLTDLVNQKNALANNLVSMGVEATQDEKLNTLVPKVLDIQCGDAELEASYLSSIDNTLGIIFSYNQLKNFFHNYFLHKI